MKWCVEVIGRMGARVVGDGMKWGVMCGLEYSCPPLQSLPFIVRIVNSIGRQCGIPHIRFSCNKSSFLVNYYFLLLHDIVLV